ncbi:MAG: hypothetical protein IKR73_07315, partial [Oscillospiraceae bacterium]|nr:hypothetical protein [Oscillospiraceae bacterium]
SVSMSFFLSLTGSLMSGHFAVKEWLLSFAVSLVISIIISLLIPMKPLSDRVCDKFGTDPMSVKGRLISTAVSDAIYTPILTVVMCFTMTSMAAAQIDRNIAEIDAALPEIQAALDGAQADYDGLLARNAAPDELAPLEGRIASLNGEIDGMRHARAGMMASRPSFLRSVLPSMLVCYIVGFILISIFQPLFLNLLTRRYGGPAGLEARARRGE